MLPQFVDALKQRLESLPKENGKTPYGAVARDANISKVWLLRCLHQKKFDRDQIKRICQAAGWQISVNEIECQFDIKWANTLSRELGRRIADQGVCVIKLAARMGLSRNNLYIHLYRNRFSKDLARRLCMDLGFNQDDSTYENLDKKFDVDWSNSKVKPTKITLMSAFHEIDRQREKVSSLMYTLGDKALNLFESMDDGDFLVFVSSTVESLLARTHYREGAVSRMAADALHRGARILLLCPTESVIENYYRNEWNFQDKLVSTVKFRDDCNKFREFATRRLDSQQVCDADIEQALYGRFGQFEVPNCPFFMPGFAINLFGSYSSKNDQANLELRITIRLPGDELGGVLAFPKTENTKVFHTRFETFVRLELLNISNNFQQKIQTTTGDDSHRLRQELQLNLLNEMNMMLSGHDSDNDSIRYNKHNKDT